MVAIWTSGGVLLTEETIPFNGNGLRWHWKDLDPAKRVVLLPSEVYVIGHYSSGEQEACRGYDVPFDPVVRWLEGRQATGYAFPCRFNTGDYMGLFGPNFRFTSVPESAGVQLATLLGLGIAALVRRRARQ